MVLHQVPVSQGWKGDEVLKDLMSERMPISYLDLEAKASLRVVKVISRVSVVIESGHVPNPVVSLQ